MQEYYIASRGGGELLCRKWLPETEPLGVVQLVHGIAEHTGRYDDFARYLASRGYVVVAEDHMGHGGSINDVTPQGCFAGGWSAAVQDLHGLYELTRLDYPALPYFLFGHSMGSFLARSFLIDYPEADLAGCILSGTAWQPAAMLSAGKAVCRLEIKRRGAQGISDTVYGMAFGSYNKDFEPVRTPCDWLSRDEERVDDYVADPLCGFIPSVGLLGDMMDGLSYNQKAGNLAKMNKTLPIYFMSGDKDPVGAQGKGVTQSVEAFRKAGMQDVEVRLYPGGRHEMLNELNREAVYAAVLAWLESKRN